MNHHQPAANILQSFKMLRGNTRISVICEPLWGIPYVLYSFYLSLYMKELGITSKQLGYLMAIGFIANILFSMIGGVITDQLGRKKTTFIFDFLAWPVAVLVYLISGSFWWFALAQVFNSMAKITAVSWNLMVVEDATPREQVAAYNLLNAINISVGVITPLAGIFIKHLGIINGERILLGFTVISMAAMIIIRNHYYHETKVGQGILDELKKRRCQGSKTGRQLNFNLLKILIQRPRVLQVLALSVFFNAYLPIGTYLSLYYAPFLTEVLQLDKSAIAILGGVNAFVMLCILTLLAPRLPHNKRFTFMAIGLVIQILALGLFITIPPSHFSLAILCVALFATGFGIVKPFIDAVLAEVSEGKERAGIYTIHNTAVSILSAGMGVASGYLYEIKPALIYLISIGILVGCVRFLTGILKNPANPESFPPQTLSE